MTLQVSFDQFAETVKRLLNQDEAYVSPHEAGSLVTAAKPEKHFVIASITPYPPEVATGTLQDHGLKLFPGTWLTPEEVLSPVASPQSTYIAAVAYRSSDDKAGLWVDAYPKLPTQMSVLRTMFEEFRSTGELDDIQFEDFVQLANPNVVIVSPDEIDAFVRQKEDC
jgi:hypothetical protein